MWWLVDTQRYLINVWPCVQVWTVIISSPYFLKGYGKLSWRGAWRDPWSTCFTCYVCRELENWSTLDSLVVFLLPGWSRRNLLKVIDRGTISKAGYSSHPSDPIYSPIYFFKSPPHPLHAPWATALLTYLSLVLAIPEYSSKLKTSSFPPNPILLP